MFEQAARYRRWALPAGGPRRRDSHSHTQSSHRDNPRMPAERSFKLIHRAGEPIEQSRRPPASPATGTRATDSNCRSRCACEGSSSSVRGALPRAGGSCRSPASHFVFLAVPVFLSCLAVIASRVFSRISSTARSRGRLAAFFILMISARAARQIVASPTRTR